MSGATTRYQTLKYTECKTKEVDLGLTASDSHNQVTETIAGT